MARYIRQHLTVPVTLPAGTGAADQLTNLPLDFDGKVIDWYYVASVVATGAGATRTFNLEIGAVNVTGSDATALTLADADTIGQVTNLGTPTALNEFRDGDTLSIEVASGGTAFTAGSGAFVIVVQPKTRGI